jgi:hypothetical protein
MPDTIDEDRRFDSKPLFRGSLSELDRFIANYKTACILVPKSTLGIATARKPTNIRIGEILAEVLAPALGRNIQDIFTS